MSGNAKEIKIVNDERKQTIMRRFIAEGKDTQFVLMSFFNLP